MGSIAWKQTEISSKKQFHFFREMFGVSNLYLQQRVNNSLPVVQCIRTHTHSHAYKCSQTQNLKIKAEHSVQLAQNFEWETCSGENCQNCPPFEREEEIERDNSSDEEQFE